MRAYQGKGARLIVDVVREGDGREWPSAVQGPRDVAETIRGLQRENRWPLEREAVGVVLLDARHRILGVHVASIGTVNGSTMHPREVYRPAVVAGAVAIVLVHNHPSGDPRPSADDRAVTERVRQAGELLGIECLDHVVVGGSSHYSFAEAC